MALKKCLICNDGKVETELGKLKCEHSYCWVCLNKYISSNLSSKIKCPDSKCSVFIRDAIIRKVLGDDDTEKYEKVCLNKITQTHFCLLPKCSAPVSFTDNNIQYQCCICSLINCILCKAPHGFWKCKDFQSKTRVEKTNISQIELQNAEQNYNTKMGAMLRNSLLEFDEKDLLENNEIFTCGFCDLIFGIGSGIKLQNCYHNICKSCLINYVNKGDNIPIPCPYCDKYINDREIKSILSTNEFTMYQRRCKNIAKKQLGNHFQCKTPDCDSFCEIVSDSINEFKCKKCNAVNCIKCKAIHQNENCQQYQAKINNNKNKKIFQSQNMIKKNDYMECPKCETRLKKNGGCNWIKCSNCHTELCWIRKMLRWGPNGSGDTSEGCRCMVNNIPCHKDCKAPYCAPHQRVVLQTQIH